MPIFPSRHVARQFVRKLPRLCPDREFRRVFHRCSVCGCQGPSVFLGRRRRRIDISMIFCGALSPSSSFRLGKAAAEFKGKKEEKEEESRHKLLTFPPPRNSRVIPGEEGRERERVREHMAVSYGSRSGELRQRLQGGERERRVCRTRTMGLSARFGKSHKTPSLAFMTIYGHLPPSQRNSRQLKGPPKPNGSSGENTVSGLWIRSAADKQGGGMDGRLSTAQGGRVS